VCTIPLRVAGNQLDDRLQDGVPPSPWQLEEGPACVKVGGETKDVVGDDPSPRSRADTH
jgi:hypothetical protein